MKYKLTICLFFLLPVLVLAQEENYWRTVPPAKYDFIKYADNEITNLQKLESFYQQLFLLRHSGKGQVSVVHIGDSHQQGDGPTGVIRHGIQEFFGDAGRGLVFPYQVAATNAPLDIKSTSNATWKNNRLTSPDKPVQTGICGYGIETTNPNAVLTLRIKEKDGQQATFNRMVFFLNDDGSHYSLTDSALAAPITFYGNTKLAENQPVIVNANTTLTGFNLKREGETGTGFNFFGVSLEKQDQAGVLYHTIGVNGARYDQYLQSAKFHQQLKSLHGDLFIISLGTNEAQNQYISEQTMMAACDSMVNLVHSVAPLATVLITTPAGSYYLHKKPNAAIQKVSAALVNYCEAHNVPVYDLFSITGGITQIPSWKRHELLSHDLVHYNNAGYQLQGSLILGAIATGYNKYGQSHTYKAAPAVTTAAKTAVKIQNEVVKVDALKIRPVVTVPADVPKPTTSSAPSPEQQSAPQRKSNITVEYSK